MIPMVCTCRVEMPSGLESDFGGLGRTGGLDCCGTRVTGTRNFRMCESVNLLNLNLWFTR
jgi:hypothetical protein